MTRAYELLTVASAIAAIETLQARVAELEDKYLVEKGMRRLAVGERDALAAELAAIKNQEPVAWGMPDAAGNIVDTLADAERVEDVTQWSAQFNVPLFAAPTPPVREPLTDAEIEAIARAHGTVGWQTLADMQTFARAIEAAIKEQK